MKRPLVSVFTLRVSLPDDEMMKHIKPLEEIYAKYEEMMIDEITAAIGKHPGDVSVEVDY